MDEINRESDLMVPITDPRQLDEFKKFCENERKSERGSHMDKKELVEEFIAQKTTIEELKEITKEIKVGQQERSDDRFIGLNDPKFAPSLTQNSGTCKAQLLRSASPWSIGFAENIVETSIQKAYIHHIGQAKHYIYIENQFFMSYYETVNCPIKNKISEALFNRILRAHTNHENFKLYIFIPLYPGCYFYYNRKSRRYR